MTKWEGMLVGTIVAVLAVAGAATWAARPSHVAPMRPPVEAPTWGEPLELTCREAFPRNEQLQTRCVSEGQQRAEPDGR